MPMKAFDDGTVAHLDFAAGEEAQLGQRVLVLAKKGEDAKKIAESLQGGKAAAKPGPERSSEPSRPETRANGQEAPQAAATVEAALVGAGGRVKSSPLARKIAADQKVDIATVPGSGPGGRVIRKDVET